MVAGCVAKLFYLIRLGKQTMNPEGVRMRAPS